MSMKRREFLIAAGAAAGVAATGRQVFRSSSWPKAWADARPNILVIMTDDQTVSQMSALSAVNSLIAAQGATFDQTIDPIPLCCPSRASVLTGQYPHNHGVVANGGTHGGYAALDQTNTIAKWMHDAGYRTGHIGKYMNGFNKSRTRPVGWDEWWATSKNPFLMWDYTLNHNGQEVPYGYSATEYKTDVLTELALTFIQSSAGSSQPLYMNLWYTAPHNEQGTDSHKVTYNTAPRPAPRHVGAFGTATLPADPSIGEADVSDKPAWVRAMKPLSASKLASLTKRYRTQLESLLAVDEGVSRVIAALASTGRLDNSVLIFTSDNGQMHGEHRIPSGKIAVYEPSLRIPLCVRGSWLRTREPCRRPGVGHRSRAHLGPAGWSRGRSYDRRPSAPGRDLRCDRSRSSDPRRERDGHHHRGAVRRCAHEALGLCRVSDQGDRALRPRHRSLPAHQRGRVGRGHQPADGTQGPPHHAPHGEWGGLQRARPRDPRLNDQAPRTAQIVRAWDLADESLAGMRGSTRE